MLGSWFCILTYLAAFFGNCYCLPNILKPQEWSYFVFAQQWPPAACLDVPHGKCLIPKGVDDWTVHGLWPTSEKGYPSFCNNSWPFNPASIKSVLQALEVKWPNIYADSTENSFWKHEWLKHGTCATSLPRFNNELKYFKRSLELHDRFDIYQFIRKTGIKPSETQPYTMKYIENAIMLQVNKTVKLFCKNHKQYDFPIFTSMYICLDKGLQPIDCDKIHEPTCEETHALYLPFNNSLSRYIYEY